MGFDVVSYVLDSNQSVINLTEYELHINGVANIEVIPPQDPKLVNFIDGEYHDQLMIDMIGNTPVYRGNATHALVTFFTNGLTDLADHIVVVPAVLSILSQFIDINKYPSFTFLSIGGIIAGHTRLGCEIFEVDKFIIRDEEKYD